jgi:hypothetical protein
MIHSSRAAWVDVEFRKSSFSGANNSCVELGWRKSGFSGGQNGSCVEVARDEAVFGIRDSKNVSGPVLMLGAAQGVGFLKAVQGSALRS